MLAELPLSVRLGGVLRAFGHVRLGDLHGVNTNDLLKVRNFGRKCIVELQELLRSAEAGEFTATSVADFGESLRIVAQLSIMVSRRSPRETGRFSNSVSSAMTASRDLSKVSAMSSA
ncbi:MAG: DNA-directed RNA polymerase subunit alpha C-terminal domain-containing protein [Deltaproteobacteria bacterium]|nr:DNA-directed RNA polymerase subunit alpha C-terminal domain-containing protein [Deltaproteobacteria bacterium]